MPRELFENSCGRIPAGGAGAIPRAHKNVAVLVEWEPDARTRREEELSEDETLLGLYRGVPNTARGSEYGVGATLPDTITLFQRPIEGSNGNCRQRTY